MDENEHDYEHDYENCPTCGDVENFMAWVPGIWHCWACGSEFIWSRHEPGKKPCLCSRCEGKVTQ